MAITAVTKLNGGLAAWEISLNSIGKEIPVAHQYGVPINFVVTEIQERT